MEKPNYRLTKYTQVEVEATGEARILASLSLKSSKDGIEEKTFCSCFLDLCKCDTECGCDEDCHTHGLYCNCVGDSVPSCSKDCSRN